MLSLSLSPREALSPPRKDFKRKNKCSVVEERERERERERVREANQIWKIKIGEFFFYLAAVKMAPPSFIPPTGRLHPFRRRGWEIYFSTPHFTPFRGGVKNRCRFRRLLLLPPPPSVRWFLTMCNVNLCFFSYTVYTIIRVIWRRRTLSLLVISGLIKLSPQFAYRDILKVPAPPKLKSVLNMMP